MYTLLGSDNQQYGPVSEEDVRQWIQAGRANGQTLAHKARRDGMGGAVHLP